MFFVRIMMERLFEEELCEFEILWYMFERYLGDYVEKLVFEKSGKVFDFDSSRFLYL